MPSVQDHDRFFGGGMDASTPKNLLSEGVIARLLNGRFIHGAITNAYAFEEQELSVASSNERPYLSSATYEQLLARGDVQLVAPLRNSTGRYLICVISGVLFQIDLSTNTVSDITPKDAYLPAHSQLGRQLSYIDNDGGVDGVGGYLVIFNPPNRPIFVGPTGAVISSKNLYEVPPARLGATSGSRSFVIVGDNQLYASDPLGGANPKAPLTFEEILNPTGTYYQQIFNIGFALQSEPITALCRMPTYLGPTEVFLARNLIASTKKHKFVIATGADRATWDSIQFISYAGSMDGIAGPHACTNVGEVILYISDTGRIKTLSQDQERDAGLRESYLDEPLGQYLPDCEPYLYHREWYEELDHSRSIVKFHKQRVYATTYPVLYPAIDYYGKPTLSYSHEAVAVGSIDPETRLGPTAALTWEGFHDFLTAAGMAVVGEDIYIVTKDRYGRNRFLKKLSGVLDNHRTVIFTRGYLAAAQMEARRILTGHLSFRHIAGPIEIKVSYWTEDGWVHGPFTTATTTKHEFSFRNNKKTSILASIPLRIEIHHSGTRFELESIHVDGELHREAKNK